MEKKTNKIMVERDFLKRMEKSIFSYFIKGQIRGKDVRVAVIPPDKGGYAVLDIVFGNDMKASLVTNPYEIKDEASGRIKGNMLFKQKMKMEVYECNVKPYRNSDKTLLNMLMK